MGELAQNRIKLFHAPQKLRDTFPLYPCCLFFHLFGLKSFTIIHIFFLYINYEMLYHISEDIEGICNKESIVIRDLRKTFRDNNKNLKEARAKSKLRSTTFPSTYRVRFSLRTERGRKTTTCVASRL